MEMDNWVLIKPEIKKMFAVISKSNSENELFSKLKSIKGTMIKTVKLYVREAKVLTVVVTNWEIYHKLSDQFKKKHEILIYSPKADWCEDVWQCDKASTFVNWHMPTYDRVLVLGGSKFIKKFKDDVEAEMDEPFNFNHIITVTGTKTPPSRKGWRILESGKYKKDTGFFNGPCNDNVNVFVS